MTPAASNLFDIREPGPSNPLATALESKTFHSQVAKILYVSKRVLPECLTTVAFLATRVTKCDSDDLKKLTRLQRHILATTGRGIILRPGVKRMQVRAWIDAGECIQMASPTPALLSPSEALAPYTPSQASSTTSLRAAQRRNWLDYQIQLTKVSILETS
jgi:hypothetical protein